MSRKNKSRNIYFHLIGDNLNNKRVVVFLNGNITGWSYKNGLKNSGYMPFCLKDIRDIGGQEITEEEACNIVKDLLNKLPRNNERILDISEL